MFNLLNLIRNENLKIYKKPSNQVLIGILIALILGVGLVSKFTGNETPKAYWQESLKIQNQQLQEGLEKGNLPRAVAENYDKQIKINQYRLENNFPPVENKSLWGFMTNTTNFIQVITIFTIVVGAGIVASEFSWGTIKLLLIRPVSRSKILFSKYISTLGFALFLLVLLFLLSLLIGMTLFGFSDLNLPYLAYFEGKVVETSMVYHTLRTYGYGSVQLLMMVTFAFMMSTVFRSSSLAIGLTMFLMFTGSNFVMILSNFGYNWVKYILFANMNLTQYVDGIPPVAGMTMNFSIVVLIIYFFSFNLLSWFIFNKRDV